MSPWPADATKTVIATAPNSSPHAVSMTLCRWAMRDAPKVTARTTTSAAADQPTVAASAAVSRAMRRQPPSTGRSVHGRSVHGRPAGIPLRPASRRPHREELVHSHPALLEGERAADQVEPPHPGDLLPHEGDDVVPATSACRLQARTVVT